MCFPNQNLQIFNLEIFLAMIKDQLDEDEER